MQTVTPRAHGIDISKYDLFFHPENATHQLDFVIQRVSYRLTRDEAFLTMVDAVMRVPIRGGYHYLSSDTDWRAQADKFLSFVAGYDYQFFVCDFEASFNILSVGFAYRAWLWIQYVRQNTNKPVLLYTNWSTYNEYIYPSERTYGIDWDTVPFWQSQYLNARDPNGTPSTPTGRTSPWKIWQYDDNGDGTKYGVGRATACDLNVFNGTARDMRSWLGLDTVQSQYQKIRRYNSDVYVLEIDPKVSRFQVTNTHESLVTPRMIATRTGAKYVLNGDMWDRVAPFKPQSLAASDGFLYQPVQRDFRPFLNVMQNGNVEISHIAGLMYNCVSGVRYILKDGAKPAYLSGTDVQYVEKQPRTLAGVTSNGKVILVVVDGRNPGVTDGVTLSQGADILKEFGSIYGIDLDGGGSSQIIVDGALANVPMDIDGVSRERATVNHICIYENTGVPMANYEVKSSSYDMSLRADHAVSALRLETIVRNTVMLADVLWVAPADGLNVKAGDKWAHVTSVNGQAKNGWVAIIHMGQLYCTYVDNTQTPPPPVPAFDTIEVYVNGVLKVSGSGTFSIS